jgi:neurotransmitter:Na+ symporter, NSS family
MAERQHWPSKWIFILAAIGSAAGLGNIWRFPFLAFEHGGAAFILVLVGANIIIGIPLLIMEVGLGQMMQRAAPDAFKNIRRGFRYVGWLAIIFGMMVLFYYMAVMGWAVDYLASAFTLAWEDDTSTFFFRDILSLSDGPGEVGGISWPVLSGLLLAWSLVYFSVWKGIKSVSSVVKWTATLPFAILAVLIVRALTLEGAEDGLRLFFVPDWTKLADPQLWIAAFSQVFFSLSLAFGIMIAYGSFNPERTEITKSAIYITLGNFLVSLMSGLVVFGTLGYMAMQESVAVTEVVVGGPSLVFVVFPKAISLLPALNSLVAILFFGMLLTLAIDSAFSLLEAFSAAFRDRYTRVSTKKIAFIITLVGIIGGLAFTTHAGIYYLDIVDHFVVNYGLVIVGILEAVIVGWLWKGDKLKRFVNERSSIKIGASWSFALKVIIPVFLTVLLAINIYNEFNTPYEGYPTWALIYIGLVPILLAPIAAVLLDKLASGRSTS